ncbi:MAG: CheR family methyltransferase [Chromatocurvus sp.]
MVGVGASAGGLKALKQLFSQLPGDSGLAFVVVVHLSPEHPSHLADLLQPGCPMPVTQVSETVPLEANHVYVIPPGRNLSTIDTHLRLSDLEEQRRERAPIDHFFDTLSRTHQERAIGVILSGTGSDGTLGIKKIKEAGGLTIVQEPNEADFDGMPQSAIATQLVDLVLPIDAMPGYLLRFAMTEPRVVRPEAAAELPEEERQVLQHIFAQLRARTGQDFSTYKRSTVLRRLRRRMQLQQRERLEDYLILLRESPNEVRLLADDFLITVTQFFRDRDSFDYLEQKVIPALFEGKTAGDRIRVWSVGCATGEEAYSVAMLLLEHARGLPGAPDLQVFASDLHDHSLQRAREGLYPETIFSDVSEERLKRFFVREDSSYRVRKDVREVVVFANHNLLKDPPFSHMDLIVCRNVLIYLQREAQHNVLDLFHYALNPDGFLLLGSSETVDRAGLFRVENKPHSVFRRRNVPAPETRLPVFFQPSRRERGPVPPNYRAPEMVTSYGGLHQKVVERYALPSVLLNEENHVVHISENAGRYLHIVGGDLSANVFKLAREELRLELRSALQRAADTRRSVRTEPIELTLDGVPRRVIMHIRPTDSGDKEGFCLVLFDEMDADERAREGAAGELPGEALRMELASLRSQLRAVIEQHESTLEEMQASNEELQSANEELRSTMEELETSKEELQSMNEELQTVNQENRHKVEELSQLTGDLNNLIAATEIATLFLDQELRILRVTPQASDLFNVRSSDRGRPLTDFSNRVGYSHLAEDADRVLDKLSPVEREVQNSEGKWFLMRILPYRAADRILGVVITFLEITERKHTELSLRRSEERFRALVNSTSYDVYRMSADWHEMRPLDGRGFLSDTVEPKTEWLDEYIHPDDQPRVLEVIQDAIHTKATFELEHRVRRPDGSVGWTLSRAVPILDENGEITEWFGAASDVTDRRQAEEALRDADQRKDQFLATLGHELRNPLAPLRTALDLFKKLVPDDPKLQELRGMLERQALLITQLVDDLLDVSRIKSGRVKLRLQRVDIRDIIENSAAAIGPMIDERHHELVVQQWHDPLVVEGDPIRLGQIVTNLLDNAVKYTPQGGRIRVVSKQVDRHVTISVQDNGIGMSTDMLGRVFDVFWQGGEPSASEGGLGLGLTLVKQLTELQGGSVEVHSEGIGKGSTFIARLPLARQRRTAPHKPDPEPVPSAEMDEAGLSSGAHKRVLVVDDNRDAADSMALVLEVAGHEVRRAYKAQKALDIAAKFSPEVILLDIAMPDMDGYALAEKLRQRPETASALLIAVTGYGQENDRSRSREAGMDHHLIKPVDSTALLKLVQAN